MSLGLRAEANNTSAVISVAGTDQVVITNAGNVVATTFTGALVGTAATATNLATSTGAAPVYGARAWVNFDGTRDENNNISTANTNRLIRASGNVSSVLRNGLGDCTINFTIAMPDANYVVVGSSADTFSAVRGFCNSSNGQTTAGARVLGVVTTTGALLDHPQMFVSIFR